MKPVNDGIRRNSQTIKDLFKSLNLKACLINEWETTIADPTEYDLRVVVNHIVPLDYLTSLNGSMSYSPKYIDKIYYTFDVYFGYDHDKSQWNWFRYICPTMKHAKSFIEDYNQFRKTEFRECEFEAFKDKYIRLAKGHFKNWIMSVDVEQYKVNND